MTTRDNPQVFPWSSLKESPGISLRDLFAGISMAAMIIKGSCHPNDVGPASYAVADSMLKARK